MPVWLFSKATAIIVLLLVSTGYATYMGNKIYQAGEDKIVLVQAKEQAKVTKKVQKDYEQIDQNTPTGESNDAELKWLSQYTSGSQQ